MGIRGGLPPKKNGDVYFKISVPVFCRWAPERLSDRHMIPKDLQDVAPARWWTKTGADSVQCVLCPRQCRLREGERGFCFIRHNLRGELRTRYGYVSALAIDPVEKKPLYHFFPGTQALSLGTIGCNLGCVFCQNWGISQPSDPGALHKKYPPAQVAQSAHETGCQSVAFTYNEPIVSAEYVLDAANACHQLGIKTVAVTAGYISAPARRDFFAVMDAANVDLKSFSEHFYKKLCQAALDPVLDTLRYLRNETQVWTEITNLLIPDENDAEDELRRMCDWILMNLGSEVPVHFSAFHPDFQMTRHRPTPPPSVKKARRIALEAGLRYVYTGNIVDVEGSTTFCHHCRKALVRRQGYEVVEDHLRGHGQCVFCHTRCAGHF